MKTRTDTTYQIEPGDTLTVVDHEQAKRISISDLYADDEHDRKFAIYLSASHIPVLEQAIAILRKYEQPKPVVYNEWPEKLVQQNEVSIEEELARR